MAGVRLYGAGAERYVGYARNFLNRVKDSLRRSGRQVATVPWRFDEQTRFVAVVNWLGAVPIEYVVVRHHQVEDQVAEGMEFIRYVFGFLVVPHSDDCPYGWEEPPTCAGGFLTHPEVVLRNGKAIYNENHEYLDGAQVYQGYMNNTIRVGRDARVCGVEMGPYTPVDSTGGISVYRRIEYHLDDLVDGYTVNTDTTRLAGVFATSVSGSADIVIVTKPVSGDGLFVRIWDETLSTVRKTLLILGHSAYHPFKPNADGSIAVSSNPGSNTYYTRLLISHDGGDYTVSADSVSATLPNNTTPQILTENVTGSVTENWVDLPEIGYPYNQVYRSGFPNRWYLNGQLVYVAAFATVDLLIPDPENPGGPWIDNPYLEGTYTAWAPIGETSWTAVADDDTSDFANACRAVSSINPAYTTFTYYDYTFQPDFSDHGLVALDTVVHPTLGAVMVARVNVSVVPTRMHGNPPYSSDLIRTYSMSQGSTESSYFHCADFDVDGSVVTAIQHHYFESDYWYGVDDPIFGVLDEYTYVEGAGVTTNTLQIGSHTVDLLANGNVQAGPDAKLLFLDLPSRLFVVPALLSAEGEPAETPPYKTRHTLFYGNMSKIKRRVIQETPLNWNLYNIETYRKSVAISNEVVLASWEFPIITNADALEWDYLDYYVMVDRESGELLHRKRAIVEQMLRLEFSHDIAITPIRALRS